MNTMDIARITLLMIGIVMVLAGTIICIVRKKCRKQCSIKVTGVCADSQHFCSIGDTTAHNFGVYEYQYQGKTYYKTSLVGTTGAPPIGKKKTLYINPDKPEDCMIDSWGSAFGAGVLFFIGFAFLVAFIIFALI